MATHKTLKPLTRCLERCLKHCLKSCLKRCLSVLRAGVLAAAIGGTAWAETPMKADMVWVKKSENVLVLLRHGKAMREYPVSFGPNPRGHKRSEGDGRTPEGVYYIQGRNPNSRYHLALQISYPNERDKHLAARRRQSPGGQIMIHGLPNNLSPGQTLARNWTNGCVGVANHHIREIWNLVDDGTPVYIEP